MTGFAGSQHSDERRRRRLAVEQDGAQSESFTSTREANKELDAIALVELAIQALIPRSIWPHLGVALVLAMLVFGSHAALDALPPNDIADISQLRQVVDESQRVVAGLCLFVTMQICVVIRQVRGRSRNDFDGRYRLWNWAVVASGFFCAAIFLNLHRVAGGIVAALLNRPDLTTSPITWQVPVLTIGGLLLLELGREMREHRPTSVLLYLSCLCYMVPLLSSLKPVSGSLDMLPPLVAGMPIEMLAFSAANILLFTTMSLHARYVVHFNPEPPTSVVRQFRLPLPRLRRPRFRRPRFLRLPKFLHWKLPTFQKPTFKLPQFKFPALKFPAFKLKFPTFKLKLPKRKPRAAAPVAQAATEAVKPAPKKKKAATPRRTRTEPAHIEPPAPQSATTEAFAEQMPPRSKRRTPPKKAKTRASQRPIEDQIDEVTADELKGLSKKQKRELRKKRREAQRAAQ
ncbi:hypothetical protein CA54_07580 [Symmachiella macrocystis]|uniref:Uncharacterized protein n=1 Tax=Symmachiella macrocystis TaxID=2527985 RepID=A0A5C6BKT0_9PLAN|nr:hypothetical protein [Symmachiella macrocystis]TWU11946.1 hypothetical protein CA54_07580 [Symmachiella macrocystis]